MTGRSSLAVVDDAVPRTDVREPRSGVDRLYLVVVALLPWLPTPTFDGPTNRLAPLAMLGLGFLYLFWAARKRQLRRSAHVRIDLLILFLVSFVAAYALQIATAGRFAEMEHLLSRVFLFIGILVTVEWLSQRDVAVREVYGALMVGFASLSVLIIFQAITGIGLLEPVAPGRTFGERLPFSRNTGVPRSYGELSIIASAALAYLLTHGRRLHPVLRTMSFTLVLLAILLSQSRNTWAAAALVIFGYLLLHRNFRVRAAQFLALLALLAPLAVDIAIPLLERTSATAAILGERTTRRNVDDRLTAVDEAVEMLVEDPTRSLWGFGREAWSERIEGVVGQRLGMHNNYLAQLVFLGVLAGGMSILVLYVLPTWRLIAGRAPPDARLLVYLSALGAFVSLNFYEGWFSPTLAIILGALWFTSYSPETEPSPSRVAASA